MVGGGSGPGPGSGWPPFVTRSAAVAESVAQYPPPFDAVALAAGRDLGRAAGTRALGVWQDRLAPGARTGFTHAHLREEEVVYVLAGRPTLRWVERGAEPREVELATGDLAVFPAASGLGHCFVNRADEDAVLLVVGERRTGERLVYPEDPLFEAWRAEHRPARTWPDADGPRGDAAWPAWRVHTERLVLRPWAVEDSLDLLRLRLANERHLAPWMPWARTTPTADELLQSISQWTAAFAAGDDWPYGVFLPDGTPIGSCGLHPRVHHVLEIGYWIGAEHEGKGYVTELSGALTRLALETRRVQAVEIHCDPKNARSAAVPARLGFRHVATLPARQVDAHGRPRDSMVWSMSRDDLAGTAASAVVASAWDGLGRRLI